MGATVVNPRDLCHVRGGCRRPLLCVAAVVAARGQSALSVDDAPAAGCRRSQPRRPVSPRRAASLEETRPREIPAGERGSRCENGTNAGAIRLAPNGFSRLRRSLWELTLARRASFGVAHFSVGAFWPKASYHRSLGQRPRNCVANRSLLAEGHSQPVVPGVCMAFGQRYSLYTRFLGRCPRLRCTWPSANDGTRNAQLQNAQARESSRSLACASG
jgi:hypothetical protein